MWVVLKTFICILSQISIEIMFKLKMIEVSKFKIFFKNQVASIQFIVVSVWNKYHILLPNAPNNKYADSCALYSSKTDTRYNAFPPNVIYDTIVHIYDESYFYICLERSRIANTERSTKRLVFSLQWIFVVLLSSSSRLSLLMNIEHIIILIQFICCTLWTQSNYSHKSHVSLFAIILWSNCLIPINNNDLSDFAMILMNILSANKWMVNWFSLYAYISWQLKRLIAVFTVNKQFAWVSRALFRINTKTFILLLNLQNRSIQHWAHNDTKWLNLYEHKNYNNFHVQKTIDHWLCGFSCLVTFKRSLLFVSKDRITFFTLSHTHCMFDESNVWIENSS